MSRGEHNRVQRMVALKAAPETVWAAIGGFGVMASWHPLIASVEVVDIEGEAYRHLTTTEGEKFFEKLVETGPNYITYTVEDGPLPTDDYRATLSVVPEEEGCHVFWGAYFEPVGADGHLADEIVAKFYEIGLEALAERYG